MARIRSVKPEFFTSPSVARLSMPARLTLVGLFTEADDEGRFNGTPKKLAGSLYPYDDSFGSADMAAHLLEIESEGIIERYTVGGVDFFHFPKWDDHQKISKPTASRLPNPSEQDVCAPPESPEIPQESPGEPREAAGNSLQEVGSRKLDLGSRKLSAISGEIAGNPDGPPLKPKADDRTKARAKAIVNGWWEKQDPKPANDWIGVVKVVEAFLASGHEPSVVARGLAEATAPTKNAITHAISMATKPRPQPKQTNGEVSRQNISSALARTER